MSVELESSELFFEALKILTRKTPATIRNTNPISNELVELLEDDPYPER